jgi:hypothetical protein
MPYKKLNSLELFFSITTSLLIFFAYLIFNLNYLTRFIDERLDSKTYRNYIYVFLISEKNNKVGIQEKFNVINPHHIAFDMTGLYFYKMLIKPDNYNPENLMIVLQLRNLIISSAFLALLFFILYKFSKKYILSFLMICLIGFSCGYWIYSQINDTPIIHSVLVALLFFASIYFPYAKNKYIYSIFLGLFHSINIFYHQSDLIFTFVIIFIMIFHKKFKLVNHDNNFICYDSLNKNYNILFSNSNKLSIRYLLLYFFTLSFVITIAYYYVGLIYIGLTLDLNKAQTLNKIKDSTYFFNWLVLYSKIEYWGKGLENFTITKGLEGIRDYFYQNNMYIDGVPIKMDFKHFFYINSIFPNIIIFFWISIFFIFIIFKRDIYIKYNYIIIANLLFIFIYVMFALWWEPDYREFWVAPMFSFWIFAFLILNFVIDRFKYLTHFHIILIYFFIFIFAFLLFFINFTGFLYNYSDNNLRKFNIIKNENNIKIRIIEDKNNK